MSVAVPVYHGIGDDLPRAGIWARMPYLHLQFRGAEIDRAQCAWCGRHDQEYGYHLMRCNHMPPRLERRRDAVLNKIHADVCEAAGDNPRYTPAVTPANLDHLFRLHWVGRGKGKRGHQPTREVLVEALWFFRDMINTYRRSTAGTGQNRTNPIWELPVYGHDPYKDCGPQEPNDDLPRPRSPPRPRPSQRAPSESLAALPPPPSPGEALEGEMEMEMEDEFGFSPDEIMASQQVLRCIAAE